MSSWVSQEFNQLSRLRRGPGGGSGANIANFPDGHVGILKPVPINDISSIAAIVDPNQLSPREIDLAMQALPPQARIALEAMAQMQNRPAEDVLRDQIRQYIAGRMPIVNIDAAMQAIQATAHTAGYLIGRLRRLARETGSE